METLPKGDPVPPSWRERFSRQIILPQVGEEGQKKWNASSFLLAGDGPALEAAGLALASSGVSRLWVHTPGSFDPSVWISRVSALEVEKTEAPEKVHPRASLSIVLTQDPALRKKMNRLSRKGPSNLLFGWTLGKGFALYCYPPPSSASSCPCLECFEALNPKAFNPGATEVERILGAMAASEALQWALTGSSPLAGKLWVHPLSNAPSLYHEVSASPKCPAALADQGVTPTP